MLGSVNKALDLEVVTQAPEVDKQIRGVVEFGDDLRINIYRNKRLATALNEIDVPSSPRLLTFLVDKAQQPFNLLRVMLWEVDNA